MNEAVMNILVVMFPVCMSLTVVLFIVRNWIVDTKWCNECKQMMIWLAIFAVFQIGVLVTFPFVWDDFAKLTLKEVDDDKIGAIHD